MQPGGSGAAAKVLAEIGDDLPLPKEAVDLLAPLNLRQQRFAIHYLRLGNAARAAREAGYARKGAYRTAYRLMENPKIAAAIRAIGSALHKAAASSAEEVVESLTRDVRVTMGDFCDEDGCLTRASIEKAMQDPYLAGAVQRIRFNDDGGIEEFQLKDSTKSIERLSKIMGWDRPERHEHQHQVAQVIRLEQWGTDNSPIDVEVKETTPEDPENAGE